MPKISHLSSAHSTTLNRKYPGVTLETQKNSMLKTRGKIISKNALSTSLYPICRHE